MPDYVVTVKLGQDVNRIAESMREAGATIISAETVPASRMLSGVIVLECTTDVAEDLKNFEGVKSFEEEDDDPYSGIGR